MLSTRQGTWSRGSAHTGTLVAVMLPAVLCCASIVRAQASDIDNDGVIDAEDNCPDDANSDQIDCDHDGIGDVCAIASGVSDDCNGNGMPDDCETDLGVDGFDFPDLSSTAGLRLLGDSQQADSALRLTPARAWQVGAAWFSQRRPVADGFDTLFQFQITEPGGVADPQGLPGGDGLSFVIQDAGDSEIGGAGVDMGYAGIPNSLAVEFDTWHNTSLVDPDGNHVSVQSAGAGPNRTEHVFSLGSTSAIPDLSDGNVHTVMIQYRPGLLDVFVDDLVTPALSVDVDLSVYLDLIDGRAWIGFTASTGSAWQVHDILQWSFSTGIENDCNDDGIPDDCEPDPDADAVPDGCDNCPNDSNPDQADGDADGVGDACDACPTEDATGNDADGDGCIDANRDETVDLGDVILTLELPAGLKNALVSKADAADAALARGNYKAAKGILGALSNQINAQTGKKISEVEAAMLIALVEEMLMELP